MKIVFTNQIPHRAAGNQEFVREHTAGTVHRRQQFLRDDALQRIGELQHNLALGAALENADDSLQRQCDVRRMQRREHQMAGLSRL